MLFSVFKIFFKNLFSFGNFIEGFKKENKRRAQTIIVIIAIIYAIAVFLGMYSFSILNTYKMLKQLGKIDLMPVLILLAVTVMTFFFGVLSIFSNYWSGANENQFLAMPLKPLDIFGAKFAISYVSDAIIGIAFIFIGGLIYGINEHCLLNPLFYLGLIIYAVAIVAIVMFVIYVFLILVLTVFPKLRKRSILIGIATAFILVFSFAYGFFSERITAMINNLSDLSISLESNGFLVYISQGMIGKPLPMLIMIVIIAAIIFLGIPLLAPLYIKTMDGFADIKSKKLSVAKADDILKNDIKTRSIKKTLLIREIKSVFNEPSFFLNGPFIIVLLPIMFLIPIVIAIFSEKGLLSQVKMLVQNYFISADFSVFNSILFYSVLIIAGISIFLGNSTSMAGTSFTREGKGLMNLKAMPITVAEILNAKITHAFIYVFVSFAITTIFYLVLYFWLAVPYTLFEILKVLILAFVLTYAVSYLLILIDIFFDLLNPKLDWENPNAAMKQNIFVVVVLLINLLIIALCVVVIIFLIKTNMDLLCIFAVIIILAALFIKKQLYKTADKKYLEM